MLGKIYSAIVIISVITAAFSGKMSDVSTAALTGAIEAVKFTLELIGVMCFWCGIMKVLESVGVIKLLAKFIFPVLKLLFPESCKSGKGINEISMNLSANLLGLGNAATPMGLKAMEKLKNEGMTEASDDMVMLTVLNTASIQVIPTTLIAIRTMCGSVNPYEVVMPIWICSVITVIFAALLTRVWNFAARKTL